MKQAILKSFLLVLLLLSLTDTALAHSTKGRKKVHLDVDQPTIDDLAYFTEGYVLGELYRNREPNWKNRFYVKEFKGLDIQGNKATLSFLTLDTKTNKNFPDTMRFERGADKIWSFSAADGSKVKVHTYVTSSVYYSKKYGTILSIVGVAGTAGGLVLLVVLRRRQASQPDAFDQFLAQTAGADGNQPAEQAGGAMDQHQQTNG